jgi:anti-anti-sigma factor
MDISCLREGPLTIVDMSGRWPIGAGEIEVRTLQALMARLIAAGRVHVAFNLSGLASLDARGLGEIAQTHKNLGRAGGALTLIAPNPFVRKMLAVTRLDTVIAVHDEVGIARRPMPEIRRAPFALQVERAPG